MGFLWNWELGDRLHAREWLKRHHELLLAKESQSHSRPQKDDCISARVAIGQLTPFINEDAEMSRDQQGVVGVRVARLADMPRDDSREERLLTLVILINGLTG